MFDNLKSFIVARTDSSTEKVMAMFVKVNGQVEKNSAAIEEIKQTIEKIETRGPEASSTAARSEGRLTPGTTTLADKYSFARRSLRLWPVDGGNDLDIRREALRFIHEKLRVPEYACNDSKVVRVRRTRQPRRRNTNVNNKVLITFDDRHTRDDVASHGRNLADYVDASRTSTAGMRMNYPDHLSEDFRVLEWYGAEMSRRVNDNQFLTQSNDRLRTKNKQFRFTLANARSLEPKIKSCIDLFDELVMAPPGQNTSAQHRRPR